MKISYRKNFIIPIAAFVWILAFHPTNYAQLSDKQIERGRLYAERQELVEQLTLPDYEDYVKYKKFWKKRKKLYWGQYWDKKGMFRLFPAGDCEKKYVITTDDPCINFVPSLTSYNFRISNYLDEYQIENDYDIKFTEGKLISRAFLNQGLLVALGEKDIQNISLSSAGMKFLNDFQPAEDIESARKQFEQLSAGINKDGFSYSNQVTPKDGMTYALRVIPYRVNTENRNLKGSEISKIVDPKESKINYQFRNIEKTQRILLRLDSIFVFKIIRVNEKDRGLTIIWKRLSKQESPRLSFAEDKNLGDFK